MKRVLTKADTGYYWYDATGTKREDYPQNIRGDLSGIRGDLTGISGNLTGIRGDLTGIRGDLSGISGDIGDAEITDAEREAGIEISELIK